MEISIPVRNCDGCTICCEGWLWGEAYGKKFYSGSPCHFLSKEKGCSIYENRPENPCKIFRCEWLNEMNLPEWLKPNVSKLVITKPTWGHENKTYYRIKECGQTIDSTYLNWIFNNIVLRGECVAVQVGGGWNYYGATEFIDEMLKNQLMR